MIGPASSARSELERRAIGSAFQRTSKPRCDKAAFAKKVAHYLAELNAIHPFREGNGRTQLSFLILLAEQAGHPLQLEKLDPAEMLDATIMSFGGDERALEKLLAGLL